MRTALALFALATVASCESPASDAHVLWFAPGNSEQNYILSDQKPNPY